MSTMNISLSDEMRAYIEREVASGQYESASEFVRSLLRDHQKRAAQKELERKLLEGLNSGPAIEVDEEFWKRKRQQLRTRFGKAKHP